MPTLFGRTGGGVVGALQSSAGGDAGQGVDELAGVRHAVTLVVDHAAVRQWPSGQRRGDNNVALPLPLGTEEQQPDLGVTEGTTERD